MAAGSCGVSKAGVAQIMLGQLWLKVQAHQTMSIWSSPVLSTSVRWAGLHS